jgi:hypothetical protein
MGKSRSAYRVSVGKLREEDHLKDRGVDGRIKLIFEEWDGEAWTGSI